MTMQKQKVIDPVKFVRKCWPNVTLYKQQREIMYSVRDVPETFVPAGNELGKDFVAALIALWFFVSRRPAIVLTTSVQAGQLEDVLWGEIRKFIDTSEVKLPIQYNHLQIRQVRNDGSLEPQSKLVGKVVNKGEALLGRHVPRGPGDIPTTLAIFDEASGIDDKAYETSDTWTHRKLVIGNCYPCANFFYRGVQAGDMADPVTGEGLFRRVIKIKAEHSPNVRFAQAQKKAGEPITHETLIPGVVSYRDYVTRRKLWDAIRQCIGLDASFYEGSELLMFPPDWLNAAERRAMALRGIARKAKAIGIDPAEGGDSSTWSIVDELGLIRLLSMKTPDTSVIPATTLALMKEYGVPAEMVLFDQGGGGKQHADAMRRDGHNVGTMAFGSSAKPERKRGMKRLEDRKQDDEVMYAYKNRRAEMYGTFRMLLDPSRGGSFAIPEEYAELRRQLAPIPLRFDPEGRLMLPPKNKRDPKSKEVTLTELIGCSPDEADSTVLAVYRMTYQSTRKKAGVIV